MGAKPAVKRYETRSQSAGTEVPPSKSRVDWRRTRRALVLLDSSEESSGSSEEQDESTTSDSELDERDPAAARSSFLWDREKERSGEAAEDGDDECVVPGRRKRLSTSVLYDSDDSEGSDILVRKVPAKRRCAVIDGESSEEEQPAKTRPAENASTRKQKVLAKLKELVRQSAARRSCSSANCEVRALTLKFHWRNI